MPRFITVTANPALDTTLIVPNFAAGKVNRAAQGTLDSAGGKGVNVARVLTALADGSAEVTATGCVGGETGRTLTALLDAESVNHDFVDVSPANTRRAFIFADPFTRTQTVVNEPGALVGADALALLVGKLRAIVEPGDAVLFCGSLPPGFPEES